MKGITTMQYSPGESPGCAVSGDMKGLKVAAQPGGITRLCSRQGEYATIHPNQFSIKIYNKNPSSQASSHMF
jgi:hypothetical protein